jgi:hypothetical protein
MTSRNLTPLEGAFPAARAQRPLPPLLSTEFDRALNDVQATRERLNLSYQDHLILVRMAVFVLTKAAWRHYDELNQDYLDVSTTWNGDGGADYDDPPFPPEPPPWPRPREIGL